ncbi:hypothetical protein [Bradyrhizobium sp. LMTR 3]|uniref:hypothetical protein n=1 Tax=Bradyrhizobium sp. LMTR 3 TaxID=189873 RepID=UPI001146D8AE|nr:hypothetical protein [Bradyrhizobium sp. LMTR 3]
MQTSVGGYSGRKCGKDVWAFWFNHLVQSFLHPDMPEEHVLTDGVAQRHSASKTLLGAAASIAFAAIGGGS